jgi:hypothetical protein
VSIPPAVSCQSSTGESAGGIDDTDQEPVSLQNISPVNHFPTTLLQAQVLAWILHLRPTAVGQEKEPHHESQGNWRLAV